MSAKFDVLRQKIHQIDKELVRLLCQRIQLVQEIGHEKNKMGLPVQDKDREREVISHVLSIPHNPMDSEILENLFWHIIRVCRDIQLKKFPQNYGAKDDCRHEGRCNGSPD